LLYVVQALDAGVSARDFRAGKYETNPLMRPFSHGGFATMMGGFLLGDALRDTVLSRASPEIRNAADAAQAVSNVAGFLQSSAIATPHARIAVPVHGIVAIPNEPRRSPPIP
jgi:hypothetical protein